MIWLGIAALLLAGLVLYDLTQSRHAILRNFPIIGHFRYLLESVGPELRQYIVTGNDEERPFSRDQRSWVYASAKHQNNYFGFGTDNDLEQTPGYVIIKHAAFPLTEPHEGEPGYDALHPVPCAKVVGGPRGRAKAFRPASVVNIGAMSYGSLSARAVEAVNRGVATAGALQNTGEGGVSPHHQHGGDLIWQLGTGYYGARDEQGRFSMERLKEVVARVPSICGIELKLSQGAKPGRGGVLPSAKITEEISQIRGVPRGKDCISPPSHSAFSDVDSLLDFVESVAAETGLPVGIKSAVGEQRFWGDLATAMEDRQRGTDWIAIDGGEGGTGAAPLVFSDHVALPFKVGFARVYAEFASRGLTDDVAFFGSGRLGFPAESLLAMAMGCDGVYVAREAMLALGCIQAQRCQTGHCPTGVATQNRWLVRGLDPTDKGARLANYVVTLRKELMWLARAAGVQHPALVDLDSFEMLGASFGSRSPRQVFSYSAGWGMPGEAVRGALLEVIGEG
jgi:glutamate synthase domain-containing protein 2